MKLLILLFGMFLISHVATSEESNTRENSVQFTNSESFSFEGTEPFWSLEINKDSLFLDLYTDTIYRMTASFSEKSARGNSIGFRNETIAGIINETWEGYCDYSISEEDSLAYEIFFTFNNKTFKGCGKKLN